MKFHINENTNFIKFRYTLVFTVKYKIKNLNLTSWPYTLKVNADIADINGKNAFIFGVSTKP